MNVHVRTKSFNLLIQLTLVRMTDMWKATKKKKDESEQKPLAANTTQTTIIPDEVPQHILCSQFMADQTKSFYRILAEQAEARVRALQSCAEQAKAKKEAAQSEETIAKAAAMQLTNVEMREKDTGPREVKIQDYCREQAFNARAEEAEAEAEAFHYRAEEAKAKAETFHALAEEIDMTCTAIFHGSKGDASKCAECATTRAKLADARASRARIRAEQADDRASLALIRAAEYEDAIRRFKLDGVSIRSICRAITAQSNLPSTSNIV
jgi:hypothetical protein